MFHSHSQHFIKNKQIDSLFFTISLLSFAEGLISIFVPIYLWGIGFSLSWIVAYYFADALFFVIFSIFLARYFYKFTDKMMIFVGMPFLLAYYFLLPLAKGFGLFIFLLPILPALHRLFFNVGYHTDFTCSSDDGEEGNEVGAQYTFVSLMQFASPLLGGLLIAGYGYRPTFLIGSFLVFVALFPLIFFKGHKLTTSTTKIDDIVKIVKDKKYRYINLSSIGYAIEATVGGIFWPLYIYLIFTSTKLVGGIFSFIGLLMALASFITGKVANHGHYQAIIRWTVPFISMVWLVRAIFPTEFVVIYSTPLKAILYAIMIVAWSGIYYKVARTTKSCGEFVVAGEIIFNFSRVVVFLPMIFFANFLEQKTFFILLFVISAFITLFIDYRAKQQI